VLTSGEEASDVEVDEEKETADKQDNITQPYIQPSSEGLHWVETFDGDALSRWIASTKEKYNGKFDIAKRRQEGLIGDVGLLVTDPAKHYGISSSFPAVDGAKDKDLPFILQFEAQFQDGLQCGGSYVKVFDRKDKKAEDLDNDTPYVIMFGPDKCGGTDKVHFILQHMNPKTGKWEEKHLKDTPRVPADHLTHLYSLLINPDNSFEVHIDGVKSASGDLLTAMEPPINPPKEIDDPADSKPSDWIDEPKMNDPDASKPDDWDEDEPYSIPDPSATMPSGWREDVSEKKIADPSAKMPQDWDEEEDGEWEAPVIDNPDCSVGCGKWNPPTINNPKYKGKWSAPKIDNPAYKGVWKPRQIANPDYFEDQTPSILPKIDSVGIDIWTMQGGIVFDNFVISSNVQATADFTEKTWRVRSKIEDLQKPKPASASSILDRVMEYSIPIAVIAFGLLIISLWCCCFSKATAETTGARRPQNAAGASGKRMKRSESVGTADPSEEKEGDGDAAEEKEADDKKED
jgi:calnexin